MCVGRDMQILYMYLQAFLRVAACCDLFLSWLHVHIPSVAFQALVFFKINAIMKCGTVIIMQAVYCLIGSVKKKNIVSLSTKYGWLVNLLPLVL